MDLIYLFTAIPTASPGTNVVPIFVAQLYVQGLGYNKISNICQINIKVKSLFARKKTNI